MLLERLESNLLLVDDDASAIHAMSRMLGPYRNKRFATCGADALRLAREQRPDLILLDADMPGMSGLSVLAALKADAALRPIPVVFVTQAGDVDAEMRALDSGVADFIRKPYDPAVLRARVRNLLDLKRQVDAGLRRAHDQGLRLADGRIAEIVGMASDAIVPAACVAVDPWAAVDHVARCCDAQAQQAQVTLMVPAVAGRLAVLADPAWLEQCLANLIGNAIEYNRPGGQVVVSIEAADARVLFHVEDDGLGMTPAQQQCLFEPFDRAGREAGCRPGVGLGLLITRRLVQAMAGELRVRSEAGAGSRFTIDLPVASPEGRP